jgi:hypothetical protein
MTGPPDDNGKSPVSSSLPNLTCLPLNIYNSLRAGTTTLLEDTPLFVAVPYLLLRMTGGP